MGRVVRSRTGRDYGAPITAHYVGRYRAPPSVRDPAGRCTSRTTIVTVSVRDLAPRRAARRYFGVCALSLITGDLGAEVRRRGQLLPRPETGTVTGDNNRRTPRKPARMLDSRWSEFANKAAPFLESGETVHKATIGFEASRWKALLGPLVWWSNVKILAVTDLHVYLLSVRALEAPTPAALAEKNDIGDVVAEFDRSFPFSRLTYQSRRRQAGRTLWIAKRDHNDAQGVVEAIGSGRR